MKDRTGSQDCIHTVVTSDENIAETLALEVLHVFFSRTQHNVHVAVDTLQVALVFDAIVELDHNGASYNGTKEVCGVCFGFRHDIEVV